VLDRRSGRDAVFEQNRSHLLSCAWLAELPDASRDALARIARRRIHTDGEVLFRPGDPCDKVWLICSGKVQSISRGPEGREFVVHVAGAGETPGHFDLIDLEPRSAEARVIGEAEVLSLSASAVREALLAYPPALMQLTIDLVDINRKLGAIVADLALLDLQGRLAKLILGRRNGGAAEVDLGGSQAQLASQLGVARQSMNRALAEMQRRELIAVGRGGRTIEIRDESGLLALVAG
jgi:CRP/FNR family transcriptional regulator, cyclic AMP receptor protein